MRLKKLFLVLITGLFMLPAAAQTSWQPLAEADPGVVVSRQTAVRETSGSRKEVVLLRFENISDQTLRITWHANLYYDGNCRTCGKPEYTHTFVLAPGQSRTGQANSNRLNTDGLRVFSRFLNGRQTAELSDLDILLTNVQVVN